MWIEILNSWLFQLILKSKSNMLTKKYCFCQKKYCFISIEISLYRNIACENRPSDESLKDSTYFSFVFDFASFKNSITPASNQTSISSLSDSSKEFVFTTWNYPFLTCITLISRSLTSLERFRCTSKNTNGGKLYCYFKRKNYRRTSNWTRTGL